MSCIKVSIRQIHVTMCEAVTFVGTSGFSNNLCKDNRRLAINGDVVVLRSTKINDETTVAASRKNMNNQNHEINADGICHSKQHIFKNKKFTRFLLGNAGFPSLN